MTLVANLFAGPGTGKSTNMALGFGKLKQAGVNIEMAPEFAKDLVWEGREKALRSQPYVIGKQMYRIHRLMDEVDVIITDSPILFGLIYGDDNHPGWEAFVVDTFKSWNTLNFHLVRDLNYHAYNPKGRTQTLPQAQNLDWGIEMLLREYAIPHQVLQVNDDTSDLIAHAVQSAL